MKKKYWTGLLFLLAIALIVAILFPFRSFREPEFIEIADIRLIKAEGTYAKIEANAVFYNPNRSGARLLNTELRVFSNDIHIATVSQTGKTEVFPESSFSVPLVFEADLLKLGMSQTLSGLLNQALNEEKRIPVRFEGYCRVKTAALVYKIPVSYSDIIVFK